MIQNFNLKNIRALLTQGFTDEELRRLCYDNPEFKPVYEQLAQGMGKDKIIDKLIEYAERKELMGALLVVAKELNLARYEKHQPYYDVIVKPTTPGTTHGKFQRAIFISYAWGGESEEIVNQLDKTFQEKGITIVRDKRDLGFKGRIKEFMEQIGRGKAVIVVISEKYLKSENCMFELVQIAKNGQFYDRIFPIVLADAQIYKPVQRIKYIQHWEQQIKDLDEAMKTVSAANLQGFREEIDQYTEIRNTIAELTNIIKDMNALTPEMHTGSGFEELIVAIERKMAETNDVSMQNSDVQKFTNTNVENQRRLRLTVHRAFFLPNGPQCYFINATNLSEREIEITHIWFDCKPQVHVLQPDRPLPKRLKPDETWETWIEVDGLPDWVHENPYNLARARLSAGVVIESQENENVPEEGFVPGGPVTRIWKAQGNRS